MELGRISVGVPFGRVTLFAAADVASSRIIDLATAGSLRRQPKGAMPKATHRLASVVLPERMSAAIVLGDIFLEAAQEAVELRSPTLSL